jgi:hypothetical protein
MGENYLGRGWPEAAIIAGLRALPGSGALLKVIQSVNGWTCVRVWPQTAKRPHWLKSMARNSCSDIPHRCFTSSSVVVKTITPTVLFSFWRGTQIV